MIARKPQKFSLNSREVDPETLHRGDTSSNSLNKQHKKSAADTAASILEELGVNRSSTVESKKTSQGGEHPKSAPKKEPAQQTNDWESRILKELRTEKAAGMKKSGSASELVKTETNRNDSKTTVAHTNIKFGFHEKFVILLMITVIGIAALAVTGGHLKLFDTAIFQQLAGGNLHQLEFAGEFEVRLVKNGYNRLPIFVLEGFLRNSFSESDQVKKIQLKAFAFDVEKELIVSHFAYAGTVLSDEDLKSLSPAKIKALLHSGNQEITAASELELQEDKIIAGTDQGQIIPFQVVFFKSVQAIKQTSLQIVSYVRNDNIVFVRSPDST
ncbi:MAG: hypothetical protein H8E38_13975 [SAR324 cluster bacterium]|nr:hypothetical protein [SAR324 cluster bacterium]MBL7035630.1 hypothetical protein [SAR324 cluster bacterium]